MFKFFATVKVDLSGLIKYKSTVAKDLRNASNGPIKDALKQWAIRYRSFVQRRFATYSRGGGNWQPLKYRRGSILRDTGTLFTALEPTFTGKPGALEQAIPFGIRVGYGGYAKHKGTSNDLTIAAIAEFHQLGMGFNPVREMIVEPDAQVVASMAKDMERALKKLAEI